MSQNIPRLPSSRTLPVLLATGLTAFILASAAEAGDVNTGYFGDVAIEGYDPVAYFTMSKAVKGSAEYSYDWLGAKWRFANEEHRRLFEANPISYAPQYGGLCAEGVAYGEMTVNIEPETWEIIDGKLYLNSAASFEDLPANRPKADENWPGIEAEFRQ